ncbi:MAG: hypothetical protein Kow0062_16170 [Acidobacteriota bacterium]
MRRIKARRQLDAARIAAAAAVTLLGLLAVDAPGTYFGSAQEMTRAGVLAGTAVVAAAILCALARLAGWPASRWLAPMMLAGQAGLFLPALVHDPAVAGAVVGWNLWALLRLGSLPAVRPGPAGAAETPRDGLDRAARHLLATSLVVLVSVGGFEVSEHPLALALAAVLSALAVGVALPFVVERVRALRPDGLTVATLVAAALAASAWRPGVALAIAGVCQTVLLVSLAARTSLFDDLLNHFLERPAQLVLVSFALLIAAGTVALGFPAAAASGRPLHPTDALFTATSASCVTGLIVLDTPHDFTTFGHVVILLLIQLGGLNIMALSTFAVMVFGRRRGVRAAGALGELLDLPVGRSAFRVAAFLVLSTLAIETIGAAVLAQRFHAAGLAWGEAAWRGAFHAVSAFCNAGFSLQSDSLVMFASDPVALVTTGMLIVLGGLGFAVLAAAWYRLTGRRHHAFSLQVRLVLAVTAVLIVGGTAAWLLLEWNASLAGMPASDRLLNALFASITLRTAGFNTLDMTAVRPVTILLMLGLMFVGASPGGTGGGIKTTTVAVLLGAIPALARNQPRVTIFRRHVPLETVFRCTAIAVVAALILGVGTALLLATQTGEFAELLFEATSAFGTVGLSLGATARLDIVGKLIVTALMFLGRVGPLTIALLLARGTATRISFPEARIMVG